MEHLPLPKDPLLSPIIVPYTCKEPYDGQPLPYYPQRQGWEVLFSPFGIRYLLHGKEPTDEELTSMIQNWLFFGLIDEVLTGVMDDEDFIRVLENGEKVVTAEKLEDGCAKWLANLEYWKETSSPVLDVVVDRVSYLVEYIWKIALHTEYRRIDPRIWISIVILCESIGQVAADGSSKEVVLPRWRTPTNTPFGDFMVKEMASKGWCPFDVKRIDSGSTHVSLLYYLANLQPPRKHSDHSQCTADFCTSMSIGPGYETKHIQLNCGSQCAHFIGTEKVIQVLKTSADSLPLVQATRTGESPMDEYVGNFRIINSLGHLEQSDFQQQFSRLEVSSGIEGPKSTPNVDFVAISHVWAEGLGNPAQNSLPTCSLHWVSTLVNALPKDERSQSVNTPFWIDTICVPIEPKEMHTMAMNRLREPYQQAKHVLVLDSYLYTQKSSELTDLEQWYRVLCCSWSQRLWTFQEGRLAKNLWFQFADKAVKMEHLYLGLETGVSATTIQGDAFVHYRGHNVLRNLGPDYIAIDDIAKFRPTPDIRDMRESLKGRAVSIPSDEPLCLFCNMFLDMEVVNNLPPSERMPKFWSLVPKVPIGLIISDAREKFDLPGLHWAPKSFMGDLDLPLWYMEQVLVPRRDGFPTPLGLQIQAPGFTFSPGMLIWDDSFDTVFTGVELPLMDENGQWYFMEMGKPWNQARTDFPKGGEQLAVLLPYLIPDRISSEDPFNFEPSVVGVIGVVTEEREEVSQFKGYRHIRLHRVSEGLQALHDSVHQCVEVFVEASCRKRGRVIISIQDGVIEPDSEPEGGEEDDDEDEERETPDTFLLTNERREYLQGFAKNWAERNTKARKASLALGKIYKRDEEGCWQHYSLMARFQLQMRLRNQIQTVDQTRMWCID